MDEELIECIPNFSEGRDLSVVQAIRDRIAAVPGILVLDETADPDHHRSVITFAGPPEAVAEAAVDAAGAAAARIDLRSHSGVHPRIGALDVLPFVPLQGTTLDACAQLARQVGQEIWRRHRIPIYFYEAAAQRPERVRLEEVRRHWERLPALALTEPARQPDIGGPSLHPTAGACAVGARKLLIAFNVNLATTDLSLAQRIARRIRASSGGFPAIKALGLPLASQRLVQVSMNLTDYETTGLFTVYAAIAAEAAAAGVKIAGSELIGLLPRQALLDAAARFFQLEHLYPDRILETRIDNARRKRDC